MRRHRGQQVERLPRAVGEDERATCGVDRGERAAGMQRDAPLGEELAHGATEHRTRDGHRLRLRREDGDLAPVAHPAPSERGLDQQRRLVRRRGALVRKGAHRNDHAAAGEGAQRFSEAGRPVEIEEVMGGVRVAGHGVGRKLRSERDDECLVGELAVSRAHDPALRIEGGHLRVNELDTLPEHAHEVARELLAPAVADHEPQERRREEMVLPPLDEHDPVLGTEQLAQRVRGRQSSDAAAQDQGRLPSRHLMPP